MHPKSKHCASTADSQAHPSPDVQNRTRSENHRIEVSSHAQVVRVTGGLPGDRTTRQTIKLKGLQYLDCSCQLFPSQGCGRRGEVRAPLPVGRRILGQFRPPLEGHDVRMPHAPLAMLELAFHASMLQIKGRGSSRRRRGVCSKG